jgi:hypothetical protein
MNAVRRLTRAEIAVWGVQLALACLYGFTGFMKATQPIEVLTQMMGWPGTMPGLTRFIGFAELAGAVGLILPAATGIMPRLTALAAAGLAVIQLLAIPFHLYRGELGIVPVNLILLGLAVFVLRRRWTA